DSIAKHRIHSLINSLVEIVAVAHKQHPVIPSGAEGSRRETFKITSSGSLGSARDDRTGGRDLDRANDAPRIFQIGAGCEFRTERLKSSRQFCLRQSAQFLAQRRIRRWNWVEPMRNRLHIKPAPANNDRIFLA